VIQENETCEFDDKLFQFNINSKKQAVEIEKENYDLHAREKYM